MTAALLLLGLTGYGPAAADETPVWHRAPALNSVATPPAAGAPVAARQAPGEPRIIQVGYVRTVSVEPAAPPFAAPKEMLGAPQDAPYGPPHAAYPGPQADSCASCGGGCGQESCGGCCEAGCECAAEPCCTCKQGFCAKLKSLFHHDRCCTECCETVEEAAPECCSCQGGSCGAAVVQGTPASDGGSCSCGAGGCCGSCSTGCECAAEPCCTCKPSLCSRLKSFFHHTRCCESCDDGCCEMVEDHGYAGPAYSEGHPVVTPEVSFPSTMPSSPMLGQPTVRTPSADGSRLSPAPRQSMPVGPERIPTAPRRGPAEPPLN